MSSNPKNILFVHSSSDLYGASRIFLITITLAKEAGHNPYVILTSPGSLADELKEQGIPVIFIRLGILRRKYLNVNGLFNRFWTISKAVITLVKFIRSKKIDLVYSNTCGIFAPAIASRIARTDHLFHVHEVIESPKVLGKITALFMRMFSDRIITVSEAVKNSWRRYFHDMKMQVIYNGLEYDQFFSSNNISKELKLPPETILIGMIARVHFWKGQNYFLEIARNLLDRGIDAKFLMVGDAFPGYEYLYDEIKQKKEDLRLDAHVIDLGFRSDIPAILQSLDLFILPSINPDPLPTVILEAMASGKPVVATAHGGACEMILPGETGVLIPWNDSLEAAKIIQSILSNQNLLEEMGIKGRERVKESFSLSAYKENILKEIEY